MKFKIGSRVDHKRYGYGKITQLDLRANFAHIDLEKEYGLKTGRIKYNAIVLITDLKIIENDIR